MGATRSILVEWPTQGIDRSVGFQSQKPYSLRDAQNVRTRNVPDRMARGGRRPGIRKAFQQQLGQQTEVRAIVGSPIRCMVVCRPLALPGGKTLVDQFDDTSFSSDWTTIGSDPALAIGRVFIQSTSLIVEGAHGNDPAAMERMVHSLPDQMDTSGTWDLFARCFVAHRYGPAGAYTHQIHTRLDNAAPSVSTDGVLLSVQTVIGPPITGTNVQRTIVWSITEFVSTVITNVASGVISQVMAFPSEFTMRITRNGSMSAFYLDEQLLYSGGFTNSNSRQRFAIGAQASPDATYKETVFDRLEFAYVTGSSNQNRPDRLAAVSNGWLYVENATGVLQERPVAAPGVPQMRPDVQLMAQTRLNKIYFADYSDFPLAAAADGATNGSPGTSLTSATYATFAGLGIDQFEDIVNIISGTGVTPGIYGISGLSGGTITLTTTPGISASNIVFRIERGPKVYDVDNDTLGTWVADATKGQVPTRCPLIALYRDRMVLGGSNDAPQNWFMSRQGFPNDWQYGDLDVGRAIAGGATSAGIIPDPLTAIIAFSDDYCVFGCRNQLWVLRGDPLQGGYMANLSRRIGVIDRLAWCWGPQGELVFLSRDGLYGITPGAMSFPQRISRDVIPSELVNIDTSKFVVTLDYDVEYAGVHIYITEQTTASMTHWFFDWLNKAFWPDAFPSTMQPFSAVNHDLINAFQRKSLLGCSDGYVRCYDDLAKDDDGTAIVSSALIGPLMLGDGMFLEGLITNLQAQVGITSGAIDWQIKTADSAEEASSANAKASGTWSAGLNARPANARCRGHAGYIQLGSSIYDVPWSIERLSAAIKKAGTLRVK